MTKQEIRADVRSRLAGLDVVAVAAASSAIGKAAAGLPEFERARVVGCYLSLACEVQTGELIEACWNAGKAVCVPALRDGWREYAFVELRKGASLERGPIGVRQPADLRTVPVDGIEVVFVAGVAFDPRGGRTGHGGGHYDSMLAGMEKAYKVGLAFERQMFDEVPMKTSDIRMDAVITEKRTIKLR